MENLKLQHLPIPHFSWAIVGPTDSGKTFMLAEVLKVWIASKIFLEKNIHIVCPTVFFQEIYQQFKHIHVYDSPNSNIIDKIREDAQRIFENYGEKKLPNILIIYDDCFSGTLNRKGNLMQSPISSDLVMHGRHLHISQIFLSQQLNGIPKSVRLNVKYISLFNPSNVLEVEDFLQNMVYRTERFGFIQKARKIWEVPYNFLHINTRAKYSLRFFEKFGKLLNPVNSQQQTLDDVIANNPVESSDSESDSSEDEEPKDKKQKVV